jgi:hypothetical protein
VTLTSTAIKQPDKCNYSRSWIVLRMSNFPAAHLGAVLKKWVWFGNEISQRRKSCFTRGFPNTHPTMSQSLHWLILRSRGARLGTPGLQFNSSLRDVCSFWTRREYPAWQIAFTCNRNLVNKRNTRPIHTGPGARMNRPTNKTLQLNHAQITNVKTFRPLPRSSS